MSSGGGLACAMFVKIRRFCNSLPTDMAVRAGRAERCPARGASGRPASLATRPGRMQVPCMHVLRVGRECACVQQSALVTSHSAGNRLVHSPATTGAARSAYRLSGPHPTVVMLNLIMHCLQMGPRRAPAPPPAAGRHRRAHPPAPQWRCRLPAQAAPAAAALRRRRHDGTWQPPCSSWPPAAAAAARMVAAWDAPAAAPPRRRWGMRTPMGRYGRSLRYSTSCVVQNVLFTRSCCRSWRFGGLACRHAGCDSAGSSLQFVACFEVLQHTYRNKYRLM